MKPAKEIHPLSKSFFPVVDSIGDGRESDNQLFFDKRNKSCLFDSLNKIKNIL